jgi:flavin-dependent dehydrogenase
MRERLDQLLAENAVRAGATLLAPCRVREIAREGNRLRAGTDRGPVIADFVVAADGALGETARMAGWPDDRRLIPALECEVRVDDITFERLAAEPRFDLGTIPRGYAWVFPKRDHLSVGALSMRRGAHELRGQVERYMQLLGVGAPREIQRHGYVIPVRRRSGPFARNRVLLAGDAAGFTDPLTAEGISFALRSGQLAAEAILESTGDEVRARDLYHAALARHIVPELRGGRLLALLLYESPRARRWIFGRFGERLANAFAGAFAGEYGYGHICRRAARRFAPRLLRLGH